MGTEVIIPAPEALVSPQFAAGVPEIEATPETVEATTMQTSSINVVSEPKDPHLTQIQATEAHIRVLVPAMRNADKERSKLRLALGHELWVLQDLHAKPGYGDFVARLNSLGKELGFGRSTGYALINEYEISAGLRAKKQKDDPADTNPVGTSVGLSNARKDEPPAVGKSFTISSDPTLGLELSAPVPCTPLGIESAEATKKVELRIPESQLAAWDDAILGLQGRTGFEAATQSELVIDAVLSFASLVTIQQQQALEQAEEADQIDADATDVQMEGPCE